jgi:hypothetical protein
MVLVSSSFPSDLLDASNMLISFQCKNANKNAASGRCDYIRWVERRPATSFSNSDDDPFPSLSSASSLPMTPLLTSTQQAQSSSAATLKRCRHVNHANVSCKSTRVMFTCGRGMCHKHCVEAGGCLGKLHLANGNVQMAVMARIPGQPLPSQRLPDSFRRATATTPAGNHILTPSPAARTVPDSSADGIADPTRNLRFVSHMPDVFNQQYATAATAGEEAECG